MLWALFVQAIFIPNKNSVHALNTFHSQTLHSKVNALIDSGATESFISPVLVDHFKITTCTIPKPQTIRNVDGTENKQGKVTLATDLDICYNGIKMMHTFYIIHLGGDHMLLGMPFLAATNPNINWTKGMFKGKVITSSTDTHKWIPNQDSKVYKPFKVIRDYRHFEWPEEGALHMLNITPENYKSQIDPTMSTSSDISPNPQNSQPSMQIKPSAPGKYLYQLSTTNLEKSLAKKNHKDFQS